MKILYLLCTEDTSVGNVTRSQIKALRNNFSNLDIIVAVVNARKDINCDDIDFYRRVKKNKLFNYINAIYFVFRLKKRINPDITISNLSSVNAYNALINVNDLKVGIFHSPNAQFKVLGIVTQILNFVFVKVIVRRLDILVGISTEVVNDLTKTTGHPRIRLCYNIHEIDEIQKFRKPPIFHYEHFQLICLGNIDRNKNQLLILHALLELPKSIKLKIVGRVTDIAYYTDLICFIEKSNLVNRVEFCEFLPSPYDELSQSHILVSASFSEGLPGTIIESCLLNRPVVSSNSSLGVFEILDTDSANINTLICTPSGIIVRFKGEMETDSRNFAEAILKIYLNYRDYVNFNFDFSKKISPKDNANYFHNILIDAYESSN